MQEGRASDASLSTIHLAADGPGVVCNTSFLTKLNVAPACDCIDSPAALSPACQACRKQITSGSGCRCFSTNAPLQKTLLPFPFHPSVCLQRQSPPLLSHFVWRGRAWLWVSSCSFPLPAPPVAFPLSSHACYCSHQEEVMLLKSEHNPMYLLALQISIFIPSWRGKLCQDVLSKEV